MRAIMIATLREAVRKKTFVVMGIVAILYLLLWAVLLHQFTSSYESYGYIPGAEDLASRMITRTGLQFSSMLMALLTIMLGAGMIAAEMENALVHAILSRPIRRISYVLGKFLGIAFLSCVFATVLFIFVLGIGVLYGLSTVAAMHAAQLIKGWALYLLVPVGVLCLTLYGSVSIKAVPNGLIMIFVYILGNIGGVVEMIGKVIGSEPVSGAGIFISLISPFHTLFATMERVLLPGTGVAEEMMLGSGGLAGSGARPSTVMFVYIALYMIGFVLLALRKFGKKDIV